MNAEEMFLQAVKEKAAFVPGNVFYCDGSGHNTMRLNFSYASGEKNIEGIKRLSKAIRKNIRQTDPAL